MGGIADYTGSLVCEKTIDRAAAVALQGRTDRQVQVFSFDLFDANRPFTLRVPLDALGRAGVAELRAGFAEPGREWAAYLAGCLRALQQFELLDLADPKVLGVNLALHSTVPIGAGVSSSAAVGVATMMNLVEHFGLRGRVDPIRLAVMCQWVENHLAGAPCGIMDQVTSCAGEPDSLLRLICQPHELQPPLHLPEGVQVVGMNTNVKHNVGGGAYGITRCAAFMAHAMILARIREAGRAAGRELVGDPTRGYLANLNPDDYRGLFRAHLPEYMDGSEFLARYGQTIDTATTVQPAQRYPVQHAADHHVLEARRVKQFAAFLTSAATAPAPHRKKLLDRAGHLMYASHLSYTNDAMLGADECDWLVDRVKEREPAGLYGAKITGGGSGGTVAVLADATPAANQALMELAAAYQSQFGLECELFLGSSPGAWAVGTMLVGGSGGPFA